MLHDNARRCTTTQIRALITSYFGREKFDHPPYRLKTFRGKRFDTKFATKNPHERQNFMRISETSLFVTIIKLTGDDTCKMVITESIPQEAETNECRGNLQMETSPSNAEMRQTPEVLRREVKVRLA
ncbi:hypothetical protein Trydic_g19731 [Trypoxylus dichotomus]